jgi:hypothetical protein
VRTITLPNGMESDQLNAALKDRMSKSRRQLLPRLCQRKSL